MNATITDRQIVTFRDEATRAGDHAAAKRAQQALAGNKAARRDVAAMIAEATAQN